jgi:hypothetical protein
MDVVALENYRVSPMATVALLGISLILGAVLLMWVVRWMEGFRVSFWASLKLTAVAIAVGMVCEAAVFLALFRLGFASIAAYWTGLAITLTLATALYTVIYAYGVKRPNGQRIGIARALKVTLIQLAISAAALLAVAIVIALLVVNGIVVLPELPSGAL